jgi:hypothetical protein
MEEWWRDPNIVVDALTRKLEGLPVNRKLNPVMDVEIHQALRLLRAIASRSYGQISMLAVLDLLLAIDYFLILKDKHNDSHDNGYDDDEDALRKIFKKHEIELNDFRLWFNQQKK